MHNLKEIRKNFSEFEKSLEKRSVNIDFSNLQKFINCKGNFNHTFRTGHKTSFILCYINFNYFNTCSENPTLYTERFRGINSRFDVCIQRYSYGFYRWYTVDC